MTKYTLSLIVFLALLVSSCGYNQVTINSGDSDFKSVEFDKSIPQNFEDKITYFFKAQPNKLSEGNNYLAINGYSIKEYNVYAGNALRALEGELTLTVKVEIEVKDLLIKKSFNSKKRYKSNELNPLAQKQMTKFLEEAMQKDIIDQIVIEVSTLEM
jgi:outer membrane lipopolysaccharide assembly protein LptE/RlpB|tara:strand:+ start:2248 stop:2718 length:471 start_codon:yes stop_codon:yes gene_type:complete